MKTRLMRWSIVIGLLIVSSPLALADELAGLTYLGHYFTNSPSSQTNLVLAQQEFDNVLSGDPSNYSCSVYAACCEAVSLYDQNEELEDLFADLQKAINGEVDPASVPPFNAAIDCVWSNVVPTLDAMSSYLDAIPASWTGMVEISSLYFPVDDSVWIDQCDLMFVRSGIQTLRGLLNILRSYDLSMDYGCLKNMYGPIASRAIVVDGVTNDWSGISPSLLGARDDLLRSVSTTHNGQYIYLLFQADSLNDADIFSLAADFDLFGNENSSIHLSFRSVSNVIEDVDFYGDAFSITNGIACVRGDGLIEVSMEVPDGTSIPDDYLLSDAELSINDSSSYLAVITQLGAYGFPMFGNIPVDVVLDALPEFFGRVRLPELMTMAKNDLREFGDYYLYGDYLLTNRTDDASHFLEYSEDMESEIEVMKYCVQFLTNSLDRIVTTRETDPWAESIPPYLMNRATHLGAFFTTPYITRAMLPSFQGIFSQPLSGTAPDPTYGGVFPHVYLDFDGDGKADIAVFCAEGGAWYVLQSYVNAGRFQGWGWSESMPVPGDYDGDGLCDIAVYAQANGAWLIWQSATQTARVQSWGYAGAVPVRGDYDGDSLCDLAVYVPETGNWLIWLSKTQTMRVQNWGFAEAEPVPADYDGDGLCDIAVYAPDSGTWLIWQSGTQTARIQPWGFAEAEPIPGDYDGDGKTDVAVYWPEAGMWYAWLSEAQAMLCNYWGWGQALPVPADYDGDGCYDRMVYAPSFGQWYLWQSGSHSARYQPWGWSEAIPVN